jgi:ADP-heptose:LPS heptosyltransferase
VKILIVRYSSIGDIILTTPIVRCVKGHFGEAAEVHYLTKKVFAALLDTNPNIDKLYAIDKTHLEIGDQLKAEKYDVIIDLHNNLRTLRLKWFLQVKMYSFPKENINKFLLVKLKWNRMPPVHLVDRYFLAVQKIGVKNDDQPCELFLNDRDEVRTLDGFIPNKNFIAVAMGTQFETKQMPLPLLQKILQKQTATIILLGASNDQQRADALQKLLPHQRIISTCGQFSLRQSAFLVKQATVLLTGDTGLMHIASCFKTPTISVWGNTVPEIGMYCYDPKNMVKNTVHEVNNLSCRPCSKIGFKSCPKSHFNCMNQQNDQAIANDLLARFTRSE